MEQASEQAVIMFTGGIRCGKSRLAQTWAEKKASSQLCLATCLPGDAEMLERVARHKAQRGGSWLCLEEAMDPASALQSFLAGNPFFRGAVVLDSVDMLLSNLMAARLSTEEILGKAKELFETLAELPVPCALVSAECGLGFVPLDPLARVYGDLLGEINQMAAQICESVIMSVCGLPLALKGGLS